MLEHGFLVASKQVDDMNIATQKKGKLEDDAEEDPDESFEAFEARLSAFVAIYLASASSSKRDDYKDGQVYQERKAVIHSFLKTAVSKKCQNPNCGA